jgi:hypothetical protein
MTIHDVIPAQAGGAFSTAKLVIHVAPDPKSKVDSRLRGNDAAKE